MGELDFSFDFRWSLNAWLAVPDQSAHCLPGQVSATTIFLMFNHAIPFQPDPECNISQSIRTHGDQIAA